ncbi:MAG: zinc-binding metallopeptidase family protein [Saccharospirillum sp.]
MPLPQPDANRIRQTLHDLLRIDSPTGDTWAMEAEVQRRLAAFDVTVSKTERGNILARHGEQPVRAIAAHLDTLGAMVQSIWPNGRLELTPLGTWSARFAEGARVTVKSGRGPIRGTILPRLSSGHAYNTAVDDQPVGWEQLALRLDAHTHSADQTRALGVQPGDIVCIDPQPEFTDTGYCVSRFLDNKATIACTLEMLHLLETHSLAPALPFLLAYTNAEEVGLGAGTALPTGLSELVSVDIAPVAANQNGSERQVSIGFKDALGPHDRRLLAHLTDLAQHHDIDAVPDVFRHYHSDCSSTLHAGYDVRTALLGFGTDSTHGYERTHIDSLVALTQMLVAYVLSPAS